MPRHGGAGRTFYSLCAEISILRDILGEGAVNCLSEVRAGLAIGIDELRLAVAAMPTKDVEQLQWKRDVLGDAQPLTAAYVHLPILADASLIADEYALGLRPKTHHAGQ